MDDTKTTDAAEEAKDEKAPETEAEKPAADKE